MIYIGVNPMYCKCKCKLYSHQLATENKENTDGSFCSGFGRLGIGIIHFWTSVRLTLIIHLLHELRILLIAK